MERTAFNNYSNVGSQVARQVVYGDMNNFYADLASGSADLSALSELPRASGAEFASRQWEHKSECLPGTRVDLLDQIKDWVSDPSGRPIYWLTGMAGTGKTTVARSVARHCHDHGILGGSFFFSRDYDGLRRADEFFTTLAFQLANHLRWLKPKVCNAIRENVDISQQLLRHQWQLLILQPLLELERETNGKGQTAICVVDALDECDDEEDIRLIVQLLAELGRLEARQLRVFITSRPETAIRHEFSTIPASTHRSFILHDIEESVVQKDISSFVRKRLAHIRVKRGVPPPWPDQESLELLLEKAGNLFIYAATVCRFVDQPGLGPDRLLSMITEGDDGLENFHLKELDRMYTRIISSAIVSTTFRPKIMLSDLNRVIGSIAVLSIPLSARSLASLLNIRHHALFNILDGLHSVLDIPRDETEPIRLLHPSFREFLLDEQRCGNPAFWVESRRAHHDLFMLCLRAMQHGLKKDICNLREPGFPTEDITKEILEKCLPSELRYACRFWVYHLQQSQRGGFEDDVSAFLQMHFLHWFEVLACLRLTSEGTHMVRSLLKLSLGATPRVGHNLNSIIYDIRRFLLGFQGIISFAPLQLYCSAILFSPSSSWIRNRFLDDIPNWAKIFPVVSSEWGPTLHVISGHTRAVRAVAFSPDRQLLASASDDQTARLWDPSTGALRSTLKGHSGPVNAVVFSPDGQQLASVSSDRTVRLWEPSTGALRRVFGDHFSQVYAVAFSPDGQRLTSASDDKKVRVWDSSTGALGHSTLKGRFSSGPMKAVAFSPNGRQLASASDDEIIRFWDPSTGVLHGTLKGHSHRVNAVAFSPDGQLLASASVDNMIRLWSLSKGALRGTLKGHSDWVNAVAFSPDGQQLASASSDRTVRIWNLLTGALCSLFKGHSNWVNAVVFSPDGQLLASASDDITVRVWDPSTAALQSIPGGHSDLVNAVVFSPDGRCLASASNDKMVKVWDPSTGAPRGTLRGHSSRVNAVAFSPDGQQLASASADKTVKVWDSSIGALRKTLKGHSDWVNAVAFSPDGQQLASASSDRTVRVWDPSTGALRSTLEGGFYWVNAVALSPGGRLLASASNRAVGLWDLSHGKNIEEVYVGSHVRNLAFSEDGNGLSTNVGTFLVQTPTRWQCSPINPANRKLVLDYPWISYAGQRIVRLPTDYLVGCSDAQGDVLAFGYGSRVAFFGVEPSWSDSPTRRFFV